MHTLNRIPIYFAAINFLIWKSGLAQDPSDQPPADPAAADGGASETTTIRMESANLKAAGPFLIDFKIKPGEAPKQTPAGDWTIIHKSMSWGEAVSACENLTGGQLAVLPKLADAQQLAEALKGVSKPKDVIENPDNWKNKEEMDLGISRRYWIGLTDQIGEGNWTWINIGYPLLYEDFWYPGQPSHVGDAPKTKGEHCGSLWNPGYYEETENTHKYNDAPCTALYYAVCDKRSPTEIKDKLIPKEEDKRK